MKKKSPFIKVLYFALCGSLLFGGCFDTADTAVQGIQVGSSVCAVPSNAEELVAQVVELVNQERTARGLHPLAVSETLNEIAANYACKMIEEGFFGHFNPITGDGPGERSIDEGYIFLAIGENLAGGQTSAEQVMQDWMNSTEGHRENILAAQWSEIGIAIRVGGDYGVYWVQEFGNPP